MEKVGAVILFLVFLLPFVSAELVINEIMANPSESEEHNEWLEVFNNGTEGIDLSKWSLCGSKLSSGYIDKSTGEMKKTNDGVMGGGGYALITDGGSGTEVYNNFNVSEESLAFHTATDSLCGKLSNTGEEISLIGEGKEIKLSYDGTLAEEGYSLERIENGSFKESLYLKGTPGKKNSQSIYAEFFALKIWEVLADPWGEDGEDKPFGEWVEIYNPSDYYLNLKGMVLKDKSGKIYVAESSTLGGTVIKPQGFLVVYRDGDTDFSLNNDAYEEVSLRTSEEAGNQLIDTLSYAGSMEGMSWAKYGENWHKTVPTPGEENMVIPGCDWELKILPESFIFDSGKEVNFNLSVKRIFGEAAEVTVVGQLKDINGEIKNSYIPWTKQKVVSKQTKKYSPNLAAGVYLADFQITNLSCEDKDLSNNGEKKILAVNPYYGQNESLLEILDFEPDLSWGGTGEAKVRIYVGAGKKEKLMLYVEDKEGHTLSEVTKFSLIDNYHNYTLTLPYFLERKCGETTDGWLIVEGWGKKAEELITVKKNEKLCPSASSGTAAASLPVEEKSFMIISYPQMVVGGEDFKVTLRVRNDNKENSASIWAYLYRGAKSYSGEREANKERITLKAGETKEINLKIKPEETAEGTYYIKAKMLKDGRKTEQEDTVAVKAVMSNSSLAACSLDGETLAGKSIEKAAEKVFNPKKLEAMQRFDTSGIVLYESSTEKSHRLVPYLIISFLVVLCIGLIWKKI